MEQDKIIEQIYKLTTESKVADEKLEIQFMGMNRRIEAIENLSSKMAENLNELKHIQSSVETLSDTVKRNSQDIKSMDKRIDEIEQRPMKEKANKWKFIVDTTLKIIVGLALSGLLLKLGIKGDI